MPKFVIGIGSQRAGSTLLHKILDECTPIFMHPVKELHYYDTLYNVRHPSVLKEYSKRQVDREIDKIISEKDYGYINKRFKCYLRTNKILANNDIKNINYLDLYRPCIAGNEFLGEITPEYMILPHDGVSKMVNDLGSETKIILITRDPVERFISAYKLLKIYSGERYDENEISSGILDVIKKMPDWINQQKELSDYHSAYEKYKKHFSNVLMLSYEDMTTTPDDTAKKLADFLDMEINNEKLIRIMEKPINKIGETGFVSKEVREIIRSI